MIHHSRRPILYVDDTVEQRYAMRRILETEGFAVVEAGSGREALAMLDHSLSLAVVDVRLPDISGYDLSRKIKEKLPTIPILQVSASFSDPDLRTAGFSGGADAYIAQPVHPAELVSLVQRMLRASEAEESLRFLATLGPSISSSLAVADTMENIRTGVVPHFADRCDVYIRPYAGQRPQFWGEGAKQPEMRAELEQRSRESSARLVNSRWLVSPLSASDAGLGAISFQLNQQREYTSTDLVLAADLSNRAGLALQNCMLFAGEQSAQSALIQSEKLATAGRMAAAIAHEINNPLEALTNLIYIIEHSPEAPASVREIASSALAEVTRLAHITRQTLGFYRELRAPAVLDLSDSVRDTVELYRARLTTSHIDADMQLEPKLEMQGNRGEIRQVISNLLVNAMEAIGSNGRITLITEGKGGRAVLRIQDSGPGMDADTEARVFEPFFTTKQDTGTGLGLWITRSIVEKHRGSIRVTSRQGADSGTIFEVDFPAASEQPAS